MYSNIKKFIQNSFFIESIDNICYMILLVILFSALFFESGSMGAFSLLFSFFIVIKILFSKNNANYGLKNYEKALIIYFLIVTVSLFGSTLFALSLHGYIKTLIYILFYFSAGIFFKTNKNKILPTIIFITFLMSFEAVIAIIQNLKGVSEISGWQDTSGINPEEIISRAYGTLKPYNPNLLAGYLLLGLSSFIYVILNALKNKKNKTASLFIILFLINLLAIIYTGCRGAYLGFMLFFPVLFIALIYYINKKVGGLNKIKKRYKTLTLAGFCAFILFCITNPAISKRIESIFAFRTDSSISFRLNVYHSAIKMFLDNPFLGIGVGNQNFREIYGLYMMTGYDALGSYCVPLEIMVESGIFALIAFVVFIVFLIKNCINIIKNNFEFKNKALAFSIILMVAAFIGHGMFDTIWFRPQLQFLFWTNIAMLKAIEK